MTDRQEAKLSTYQKVLNVCDEHKQKYAGIPAFVNAVTELKQQVMDIQSVRQQQTETVPKGTTKDKSSAIDRLAELSLKVANPVYVYAFETQNNSLLQKVNVNKSMFYNIHDRAALTLAKIIASEAKNRNEALREYGISETDITELDEAIVQFEGLIDSPSGVIGERKMHTENLRTLFVRADSIIYDKLDKLIRLFKTSSPDFFALYGNARNIVNTAARKRKDKSNAVEEESGNE
ncbi:MAG: hypothetical protein LBC47_05360 [Tannerella sp.]|jgi:hypothetical protein|nr:hypothetical protein [Tannerella sp.]